MFNQRGRAQPPPDTGGGGTTPSPSPQQVPPPLPDPLPRKSGSRSASARPSHRLPQRRPPGPGRVATARPTDTHRPQRRSGRRHRPARAPAPFASSAGATTAPLQHRPPHPWPQTPRPHRAVGMGRERRAGKGAGPRRGAGVKGRGVVGSTPWGPRPLHVTGGGREGAGSVRSPFRVIARNRLRSRRFPLTGLCLWQQTELRVAPRQ